jgi:hypothetical protein
MTSEKIKQGKRQARLGNYTDLRVTRKVRKVLGWSVTTESSSCLSCSENKMEAADEAGAEAPGAQALTTSAGETCGTGERCLEGGG